MEKQIPWLLPWKSWLTAAILVVLLTAGGWLWWYFSPPDPYVQEVLAHQGDLAQGHAIFQMNCAACHGLQGNGRVGPSLWGVGTRKSDVALIYQVVSGKTPPMPQFQPSPQEMADLLQYLKSL